ELQENGVVVIDLSDLDVGEGTNHSAFASSPTLIKALQQVNVAENTQRAADARERRLDPLKVLKDLTEGIVHFPTERDEVAE
ncbi:MAG: hypothetical protein AAF850_13735, partial [Pseudomonadota bacterium]